MPGGVIDCIKDKMPWMHGSKVKIQQDGARSHTGKDSTNIIEAHANGHGWSFEIITQPAQSPEFNILDLGFFHSLKVRVQQIKWRANNLDSLITKVRQAFAEYPAETLDHIWGHLFACYNAVLRANGTNQYIAPHAAARAAHKVGPTSVTLNIDLVSYNAVWNALH